MQYAYAVEDLPCIELAGTSVAHASSTAPAGASDWQLVRLTQPNRHAERLHRASTPTAGAARTTPLLPLLRPGGWLRIAYSRPENYPIRPTPIQSRSAR